MIFSVDEMMCTANSERDWGRGVRTPNNNQTRAQILDQGRTRTPVFGT